MKFKKRWELHPCGFSTGELTDVRNFTMEKAAVVPPQQLVTLDPDRQQD